MLTTHYEIRMNGSAILRSDLEFNWDKSSRFASYFYATRDGNPNDKVELVKVTNEIVNI